MMNRLYLCKRFLLDLLYPNRCGLCGCAVPFDEYFCNTCIHLFSSAPQIAPLPYADCLVSFTSYDTYGKKLVHRFKSGSDGYALSGAAYLISRRLSENGGDILKRTDIITYVPMRRKDRRRRGYNQCRLMAEELSLLTDKPCKSLLAKTRDTRPQKILTARERRENIRDAFVCKNPKLVKGRRVLLIDDVSTTGSTLSEAAKALKAAGADKVYAAVFAKTKMPQYSLEKRR